MLGSGHLTGEARAPVLAGMDQLPTPARGTVQDNVAGPSTSVGTCGASRWTVRVPSWSSERWPHPRSSCRPVRPGHRPLGTRGGTRIQAWSPVWDRLIGSVDAFPATCIAGTTDRGGATGREAPPGIRTTTDLSSRKVYYFDRGPDEPSEIIASYTDGRHTVPIVALAAGGSDGAPAPPGCNLRRGPARVIHLGVAVRGQSGPRSCTGGRSPRDRLDVLGLVIARRADRENCSLISTCRSTCAATRSHGRKPGSRAHSRPPKPSRCACSRIGLPNLRRGAMRPSPTRAGPREIGASGLASPRR